MAPLEEAAFRAVESAWRQHLVLRFRGQHLDDPGLLAFARRFGELDKAPVHAIADSDHDPYPEITVMSNIKVNGKPIGNLGHYEAEWHTDMSYNEKTPIGSLLYALEVPPAGGDTGFSNMYTAFETLPAELKRAIAGRQCRHDSSRNSVGDLRRGFKTSPTRARRRGPCTPSSAPIPRRAGTPSSSGAGAMPTSSGCRSKRAKAC